MNISDIEIERAHRLGRVGNQRPIITKFLNFKDKEKIKSKIRQLQSDDDRWVNPHRVTDDFAPGIRNDRKKLFKYMKLARGEEHNAYLSFNKLIIDGVTFTFNSVKSKLEAVRKRDEQTAITIIRCFLRVVVIVVVVVTAMLIHVTRQVTAPHWHHVMEPLRTVKISWTK